MVNLPGELFTQVSFLPRADSIFFRASSFSSGSVSMNTAISPLSTKHSISDLRMALSSFRYSISLSLWRRFNPNELVLKRVCAATNHQTSTTFHMAWQLSLDQPGHVSSVRSQWSFLGCFPPDPRSLVTDLFLRLPGFSTRFL